MLWPKIPMKVRDYERNAALASVCHLEDPPLPEVTCFRPGVESNRLPISRSKLPIKIWRNSNFHAVSARIPGRKFRMSLHSYIRTSKQQALNDMATGHGPILSLLLHK